jgi:hypothetical protein
MSWAHRPGRGSGRKFDAYQQMVGGKEKGLQAKCLQPFRCATFLSSVPGVPGLCGRASCADAAPKHTILMACHLPLYMTLILSATSTPSTIFPQTLTVMSTARSPNSMGSPFIVITV